MRRWLSTVLLVGMGLCCGLLAAEVAVRATGLDPAADPRQMRQADGWNEDCTRLSPWVRYEYLPNRCGANSMGLQDRERSLDRLPGELRVVALGDSITADRMYTDFLETILSDRLDRPVDVLNFGVPGYSTIDELAVFQRKALAVDPDLVLLQFSPNDYGVSPVLVRQGGRIVVLDRMGTSQSLLPWALFRVSALHRLLVVSLVRHRAAADRANALVDQALSTFQEQCAAHGLPLLVVVFPPLSPPLAYSEEEAVGMSTVLGTLRGLGQPFLDLTPVFQDVGIANLSRGNGSLAADRLDELAAGGALAEGAPDVIRAYLEAHPTVPPPPGGAGDRIHPNHLGHYLAAQAISDALLDRRDTMIPPPRDP